MAEESEESKEDNTGENVVIPSDEKYRLFANKYHDLSVYSFSKNKWIPGAPSYYSRFSQIDLHKTFVNKFKKNSNILNYNCSF